MLNGVAVCVNGAVWDLSVSPPSGKTRAKRPSEIAAPPQVFFTAKWTATGSRRLDCLTLVTSSDRQGSTGCPPKKLPGSGFSWLRNVADNDRLAQDRDEFRGDDVL
jgi:hypothetical protein